MPYDRERAFDILFGWDPHDPDLGRPIAAPLEQCTELLGVDLATMQKAVASLEPYIRADAKWIARVQPAPAPWLPSEFIPALLPKSMAGILWVATLSAPVGLWGSLGGSVTGGGAVRTIEWEYRQKYAIPR